MLAEGIWSGSSVFVSACAGLSHCSFPTEPQEGTYWIPSENVTIVNNNNHDLFIHKQAK